MNAGMLLVKCTAWTENFLASVYDARKFDTARALDQSSIQSHLDALSASERKAHVKVLPKHAMNVYLEEYRPGDFLVHTAGKLYEATEKGLLAITNQLDILSQMDYVEDVAAFFNTVHLLNYYSGTCNRTIDPTNVKCQPDDKRRIRLKEPLISMSSPNRYHHVALRYYFLQNWHDKYDVASWNVKKKALPIPANTYKSEMEVLKEELAIIAKQEAARKAREVARIAAKAADASRITANEPVKDNDKENEAEKPADNKPVSAIDAKADVDKILIENDEDLEGDETVLKTVQRAQKQNGAAQKASSTENQVVTNKKGARSWTAVFTIVFLVVSVCTLLVLVYRKRRRTIKMQ